MAFKGVFEIYKDIKQLILIITYYIMKSIEPNKRHKNINNDECWAAEMCIN